jgi:hypothetical protein
MFRTGGNYHQGYVIARESLKFEALATALYDGGREI